ncbi:hypothetical protein [Paenibacillus odorifer]
MELFQAESQSQKETIERWIHKSDVYFFWVFAMEALSLNQR